MINLAGNKEADNYILEELYIADIPTKPETTPDYYEVPYTIIGNLCGWNFRRGWYYYVVSCPHGNGIPYDVAVELHERANPLRREFGTLGKVIRADGNAGCPHPKDLRYPTLEDIEEEFVQARQKFPEVDFDPQRAFGTSYTRSLDGVKYIRLYHIDSIVGLKEFAKTLREMQPPNRKRRD